jgi:hypothetical protein
MIKKVELLVESKTVELFGDESFPLTFSIDDINNIGKKTAAYSKEISIPSTKVNDQIFTQLFDVTIEGGFNPISRKRATLFVDGVAIMNGYFKLLAINIKEGINATYTGQLFEEQINFVAALDDYLLENLNITLTGTTQPNIVAPYTQLTTFQFTGLGDYYTIGKTNTGADWADANIVTGVTFGSGFYGLISQQARSTNGIPAGYSWIPSTVGAYEAIVDQYVELDIRLELATISAATYNYRVSFSDYSSPTSGLFSDYTLASGAFSAPAPPVAGTHGYLTLLNLGVALKTGDKVRVEYWCTTGNNFTTVLPGSPSMIASGTSINGRIYQGSNTITTTGFTTSVESIIKNINTVNNSDDYPIVFPLIDYSQNYKFYDKNNPYQYTSNPVDLRIQVNAEDLRPMTFVKNVWDSIFKQAGFKYKSDFLNSSTFKSMVIGGGMDDKDISTLVFESIPNANFLNGTTTTGSTNINDIYISGLKDTQTVNASNQVTNYRYNEFSFSNVDFSIISGTSKLWSISTLVEPYSTYIPSRNFVNVNAHMILPTPFAASPTNYYGYDLTTVSSNSEKYGVLPTAAVDGKYRVHCGIYAYANPTLNVSTPIALPGKKFKLQLQKLSIGSYKYYPTTSTAPAYDKWTIVKEVLYKTIATGATGEAFQLEIDETIDLKKGDMIRVILLGDPNSNFTAYGGTLQQSIAFEKNPLHSFLRVYRLGIATNSLITNAATLLPKNFKQRDFILQLSKMFNLYFEADNEDSKTLIIEPRDTYYELGKIQNWSKKIDYTKDFNIEILSHNYPKTMTFKYSDDDKDYYSSEYSGYTANKLIFGSYIFTSPNEYNTNDDLLDLKFAPSYIQKLPDSDMRITKIMNPSLFDPDSTTTKYPYKISPRIMMYKKVATPASTYSIYYGNVVNDSFWIPLALLNYSSISKSYFKMDYYGYAGHLNDPKTPTFDLNWYTDFNYVPNTTGTTQNLINVFYKNQLIELTDQTARKVTCYVDLKPIDIVNLRFCDIFYFNKEYWRLLEISDFDTSSDVNKTTKCTFIKIVRAQTNGLIDYKAFGYLGISGGSAGGILGNTDPE